MHIQASRSNQELQFSERTFLGTNYNLILFDFEINFSRSKFLPIGLSEKAGTYE